MKVLIPVQDGVFGDAIIEMITNHKWPVDTQFKLFNVVEYTTYGEMIGEMHCCDSTQKVYAERETMAKELLDQYSRQIDFALPGAFVQQKIQCGIPKEMILDEAEAWGADMIVMGSHARKGLSRFLLGSVSMAVLSQAPCSVVIVKLPGQKPAAAGTRTEHETKVEAGVRASA